MVQDITTRFPATEVISFHGGDSPANGPFDGAVVFAEKSHARTEMLLAVAAANITHGGSVYLVGENRIGVRTACRLLEQCIGQIEQHATGRRCTLYRAQQRGKSIPFCLADWERKIEAVVGGTPLTVATLPGVFSADAVDDGTRFFLENLFVEPRATVLDVGCGAGVIAACIKKRWPGTTVDLSDIDMLALIAARRTFDANHLQANAFIHTDGLPQQGGKYDQIVCNPPFHRGREIDLTMASALIARAPLRLRSRGRLSVAGNAFLPYAGMIERAFGSVQVVASNGHYTVWEGTLGDVDR